MSRHDQLDETAIERWENDGGLCAEQDLPESPQYSPIGTLRTSAQGRQINLADVIPVTQLPSKQGEQAWPT